MRYISNKKVLNFIVLSLFCGIVSIGFADESETPHFHDDTATLTVEENVDSGVNIGDPFTAHNAGSNDQYKLSGTDSDNFNLNLTTGQLETSSWIDYETKSTYSVTVEIHQASDEMISSVIDGVTVLTYQYTLRDSIAVTINVTNVDYKFLPNENIRSVAENSPAGTDIGNQIAHEFGTNTKYNFVLGGTDVASFQLKQWVHPQDPTDFHYTNQIQTKAALDYETKNSYEVTVTLQTYTEKTLDTGAVKRDYTDRDTITVTINVTDVDETVTTSTTLSSVDALPTVTGDEIAQIISLLSMDKIIFNELYNASNDTHDWLELRNISDVEVNLSGWQLTVTAVLGKEIISFPDGTMLPAGEVLLLVNTDPNAPESRLSNPGDGSVRYVVDKSFDIPQADFALILKSTNGGYEDSVGNYFPNREIKPTTAALLTANVAWFRAKPAVIGYQAEAWVQSGYREGLGYDEGTPELTSLGTPGYRLRLDPDLDGNGVVNILDLVLVASKFGESDAPEADLNADGVVNILDLEIVANNF